MNSAASDQPEPVPAVGWARLGVGLLWGLALYADSQLAQKSHWLVAHPPLLSALLLSTWFWPLIVLTGIGALRPMVLIVWSVVSLAGLCALGAYNVDPTPKSFGIGGGPTPEAVAGAALALFIAHRLVSAGDADRRWVATYPRYFDLSWKAGLQWTLAAVFTALFWALLFLGAALFSLLHLTFLLDLIKKPWFDLPATTVAFAGALHLTDVRVSLVRGVRTVLLTTLSWLLPLMTVLAAGFLIALPVRGIGLLWSTRAAATLMLASIGWVVVLINVAVQDGTSEVPAMLRWSGRIAAIILPVMVLLAGYGLWARAAQYGLTPKRIFAIAGLLVAAAYAVGYSVAAAWPRGWAKGIEPTNVAVAYLIILLVGVLFSPLADPERIAVADQIARLKSGVVTAAKFDYAFLRFHAGQPGQNALAALRDKPFGTDAAMVRARADAALKQTNPYAPLTPPAAPVLSRLVIYPKGAILPMDFLSGSADQPSEPCLNGRIACDAYLIDLDGDGSPEVLIRNNNFMMIYKRADDGRWRQIGTAYLACGEGDVEALRAGRYALRPGLPDLVINERAVPLSRIAPSCPHAVSPVKSGG